MTRTPKRPRDPNQLTEMVVDIATGNSEDRHDSATGPMAAFGRAGGLKGGQARAAALSPERRVEIARSAASARWKRDD